MRIGFAGTHSTGKTTLVNKLSELPEFRRFYIDTNVTRWIKEFNLPLNQNANDASQKINMAIRTTNLITHGSLLADRTIFDVLAYTSESTETSTDEKLNQFKTVQKASKLYDLVFYIPPVIAMEKDGVRPEDRDYRRKIDETIKKILSQNYPARTVLSSVSLDDRIAEVCECIDYYKESMRKYVS